jgi:hypothetical protein
MNTNPSDRKVVRPAAVAGFAVGAILIVLTAACTTTTQGLALPEKFSVDTALPGASDTATMGDLGACTHVDAPMLDIPTITDSEPRMRIPQPPGWEDTDELNDMDLGIRFGLVTSDPVADDPPQNVVLVTLEEVPDVDAQRSSTGPGPNWSSCSKKKTCRRTWRRRRARCARCPLRRSPTQVTPRMRTHSPF